MPEPPARLPSPARRGPRARLRSATGFALQGLGSAPQRAWLALLGVALGAASVVALVLLGQGLEQQALDELRGLGTQVVSAALMPRQGAAAGPQRKQPLREALAAAVAALPEVEQASEVVSLSCPGSADPSFSLSAVRPELARILGLQLAGGRFLHALDGAEPWVVLGAQSARQLALQPGRDRRTVAPGAELSVCGRVMRVAGVLAPMSAAESMLPVALDQGLLVSGVLGRRIDPVAAPAHLVLRLRPGVSPLDFEPRLMALLGELTGQDVQVTSARRLLDLRRRQAALMTRFLAALGAISLLVGALGILNVMLVAVLARRREIGLRLAVGADDIDIGLQFLVESALLGLAGGALGLAVGLGAGWGVALWAGLPLVVLPGSVGLGLGPALAVGIAAGLYPAWQAARLAPVTALRAAD